MIRQPWAFRENGPGTTLESAELRVLVAGSGSLVVRDGATFVGSVIDVGLCSNGKGLIIVEGAGTRMQVSDQIMQPRPDDRGLALVTAAGPVPEPRGTLLLLVGLAGLAVAARARHSPRV